MIRFLYLIILTSITVFYSCDEKDKHVLNNQNDEIKKNNTEQNYDNGKTLNQDNLLAKKYCFVVFEGQSIMSHEGYRRIVTNIFETNTYINEDEEYKLIDNSQTKSLINVQLKSVDKRYLRYFFSYSEASKEREKLLGINQQNHYDSEYNTQQKHNSYDSVSNDSIRYYFVTKPKAYFYSRPDFKTRKKSYLLADAQVYALDETEYFIYINFTNTDGITSKGWILKKDISQYY